MKLFVKILLPVMVLGVSLWVANQVIANRPEPKRRTPPVSVTAVEANRVQPAVYRVRIKTQGTVQPHTEGSLIPEVSGRLVEVTPNLREGGFFEQGEVLARIDPRDYEIAVTVAKAELLRTQATLEEEKGRAQVAERDWKQLRSRESGTRLALRKPQVAAAAAAVAVAEAQLAKAELSLERTRIMAPYAGRVLEQNADVGQYLSSGSILARIYAVDYAEIRLPLTNKQLEFVAIPELYRDDPDGESAPDGPTVILTARVGARDHHWQGRLVRAEGAIDTQSRQLFVVAQVDDPYGKGSDPRPPLRVGQFVEAEIEGNLLRDVFVVPRAVLREGNQVLLVGVGQQLERRQVDVIWSDAENAVIGAGLQTGEALVVTGLSVAAAGTPVVATIDGEPPVRDESEGKAAKRSGRLAQQQDKPRE